VGEVVGRRDTIAKARVSECRPPVSGGAHGRGRCEPRSRFAHRPRELMRQPLRKSDQRNGRRSVKPGPSLSQVFRAGNSSDTDIDAPAASRCTCFTCGAVLLQAVMRRHRKALPEMGGISA
jgi:hypothetical protein